MTSENEDTYSPRSVAVTASAEELDISLDDYDPVMEDVDGVEMPDSDSERE